jgi:thymidylate synthase
MIFNSANEAFEHLYTKINRIGVEQSNTLSLFNVGIHINHPLNNKITNKTRSWNEDYAEYEWQWYVSGNPNGEEISKRAKIWKNHMDENSNIRSNYGWQWQRNNQLNKVIKKLKNDCNSRQAVITIYDGKEQDTYQYDTPCTNSIHFQIINDKLCMTVNMRSNDLWFGFCNDQYCFSRLQEMVAQQVNKEIGWYFHFASNLHLYNKHLNKNI